MASPLFSNLLRCVEHDFKGPVVFVHLCLGQRQRLGSNPGPARMKSFFTVFLALAISFNSWSAASPAYSPNFGNAMAGVLQQKVAARGFAANDPRFVATEAALGSVLTGVASGLVVAAGAPLWATIAIGVASSVAVGLAVNSLTQWIFNPNHTITSPGTVVPPVFYDNQTWIAGSYVDVQIGQDCLPLKIGGTYLAHVASTLPFAYGCANPNASPALAYQVYQATADILNGVGTGTTSPAYTGSPATAVANVPVADMSLPVNPALLANALNTAWQAAAAQPGYQGLPYNLSDPVTTSDVQTWQAANPSSYPSVSDLLAPAVAPSGSVGVGTVPQPIAPGTVASPGTNTAPEGTPQTNLGTDPAIGSPTLESTPTAQMILSPLLNLFPDLKTFVVPSHASVCPTSSMSIFGKTLTLDAHCTLLESVRPTLFAVMAVVWVIIALFIILAA